MTQPQKGSIYAGKQNHFSLQDVIFLAIGIAGACITLFGFVKNYPQPYYVIGSIGLLLTAIQFRQFFFIALELILIAGHGTILLGIGSILQFAIPVLLSTQLLIFFYLLGQIDNIFLPIGIIGIACLSIGFAYAHNWLFFFGSVCLTIYALSCSKKTPVTLVWATLNAFFALIAIYKTFIY